jgi:hypothetical protein
VNAVIEEAAAAPDLEKIVLQAGIFLQLLRFRPCGSFRCASLNAMADATFVQATGY